jgi:hypothetical protein
MTAKNFDFGGHINDENRYTEADELGKTEEHLTVKALLCLKHGPIRGPKIYADLERMARRVARKSGGEPAILFSDAGGEFVGISDVDDDEPEDSPDTD